ncbi:MAG: isocitrate lyase/PEP mutase family protein [Gammaproteobacteria bacterium]|nr:isocitrate lyase/PEP mutase family protein [Gammaproteobacteria bacterium]
MEKNTKSLNLVELFENNRCIFPASVNDPVSARIAEDLGFEALMLAGSTASLAVLGDPDHILLTLSELSDLTRRICRASSVPLMVDADHGYGNALNVRRTVQELENSGAAGLSIEDTNLPRPYDIHRSYPLLSVEEGAAKIQAAVEARKSSSFLIAARTNAPRISSLDDTLKRIESYQKTGVDALFLVGVKTQKQLKTIQEIVKLPIMLGGAGADLADSDILIKHGVRFFVQGHQPIQAAIQTVYSTLKSLREGVKPRDLTGLPDQELIEKVTQKHRYKYLIDRYLEP